MKRYFRKGFVEAPIHAVQWDGEDLGALIEFMGGRVEIFATGETPQTRRVLIADPEFPFWLAAGEWITRDLAGDLDGWPDRNFRETYTIAIEETGT